MDESTIAMIIGCSQDNCDAGRALATVLDLLAEANLQLAEEDDDDETYERKSEAETALFLLATEVTGGRRWPR